jgi:hypothetical protein
VADVADPPTKARNVLPQFAGTDRLREPFHDAPERMSDIAAFDIRPVQNVLATLMEFRGQACRDENGSSNCDYFAYHLRPPPFDPTEPLIRVKF